MEHISDYIQLKRSGQNYKGLCPFHGEKTPSFMVHPAKQIFHCFGCGAGGDVFTFTMKHDNLTFPEALALLARKAGVELKPQDPRKKGERESLKSAVKLALTFYQSELGSSKLAAEYIKERGISEESVKGFGLGYAPQGWHNTLNHLKRNGLREDVIIKAGLAVKGDRGAYDVFRARLIFPIFDMHGEAIAFGARLITGEQGPKYLNSPDSPLFKKGDTLYALSEAREAVRTEGFVAVVEGYMDAIMCHQHGIRNVVAPLGTALTAGHLKKLARLSDRIVLLFDGDQAGVSAARRSLELIMQENMRARVLMIPEGEDPDTILRARGVEGMRALMEEALSPMRFVVETTAGPKGINDAVELIAKASDPILRDELILELSDRTRIGEQAIREKLSRYKSTGGHDQPRTVRARAYTEETLLLSVAVAEPLRAVEIARRVDLDAFMDIMARDILKRMAVRAESETLDPLELAETDEERSLITRMSLEPGFEPDDVERNISDCIQKIQSRKTDLDIEEARAAEDWALYNRLIVERSKSGKQETK